MHLILQKKDPMMQFVVERLKQLQGNKGSRGLSYEDLCVHPDVELLEGYKPPKFELYNGTGDPKAHLRMYCDKLAGVGRDERIRMKMFMRSLIGEALTWYIDHDARKWKG